MASNYHLQRFIDQQDRVYEQVLKELEVGKKQSCWMWYIFPQIYGLGCSQTAKAFSIKSIDEAKAYLDHPLLGKRLKACTELLIGLEDITAEDIFGYPDVLKFRSCMTLFALASGQKEPLFETALDKYFGGKMDEKTLSILNV